MASKISVGPGGIEGVYDERLAPLYLALGHVEIKRATHVEPRVTDAGIVWDATHIETGTVIATGVASKAEAVALEVAWLEARL